MKAAAPETKTISGLIFVAKVINRIASLSVSSATNMAVAIVKNVVAMSIFDIKLKRLPLCIMLSVFFD